MPREQINHPGNEVDEEGLRDPIVQVAWADKTVQIGFEADPGLFALAAESGALSTALYSPGLTRAETNRMIRALRRARDKAFGVDA